MLADRNPDLPAQLAEAFAWWREAGVDCSFHDEPTRWLADAPAAQEPRNRKSLATGTKPAMVAHASSPVAPGARSGRDAVEQPSIELQALPQSLEDFVPWWLAEPSLDGGLTSGRVPPRGKAGAALMVIVPEPEAEDRDRLLSGPQGRLLDAILGAMGVPPDQTYVASALPRHTPMADWGSVQAQGMGKVLAHHVRLAAPIRIIALGSSILPLMGNDPPNTPAALRQFNHEDMTVPLLVARDLATLLERPRCKADLWRAWLEWTATAR